MSAGGGGGGSFTGGEITSPLLLPNGNNTNPAVGFSSNPDMGLYSANGNQVIAAHNANEIFRWGAQGLIVGTNNTGSRLETLTALVINSASAGAVHLLHGSSDGHLVVYEDDESTLGSLQVGSLLNSAGGTLAVIGSSSIRFDGLLTMNNVLRMNTLSQFIEWGSGGPRDLAGLGTPEGSVTADVGSTYRRTDGGAGTSFYVKESGAGNTGWVAK